MSPPSARRERDFDVAIVGYGPVGAFAALLLADAGLRVAILERATEASQLPRAVGLDGESMRAFQRIGLGDAVNGIVQPAREIEQVCFTDSQRRQLFGLDIPQHGINGWRDVLFFDQPELEALLRERVAREDRIRAFLGHEVESLAQTDDVVVLRGRDAMNDEAWELRAPFALGCDGASSFVRSALGIAWQSLGYDRDWLVIDIVPKPEARLPIVTMQVCDPARLTTYVCCKDPYRRWEFQLVPGETREEMLRSEKIAELLLPWLPPEQYEIRRAAVYQFHAATVDRWQERRVFLAGDAAHQTPPFLGQGRSAPPLRSGVLLDAQTGADAPAGNLLRQPMVRGPDGRERRLDELLGRGVAVVVRPDRYVFGAVEAGWPLDRLLTELAGKLALRRA
jgi:2-polyprenyl-6-methoxyphenol hydroxylase-like FAD-dependent oxidoreductase